MGSIAVAPSHPDIIFVGSDEGLVRPDLSVDDGMITFREWPPVGVEEYDYAVPDPLNQNIIFGDKVPRYDHRITQLQKVAPTPVRPATFRTLRTAPVVFFADSQVMYFASNMLWEIAAGGRSWTQIRNASIHSRCSADLRSAR